MPVITSLLAIETATDACSIALKLGEHASFRHEVIPRQHQQRLFPLLDELLEGREIANIGLEAIAFGSGPGSFTGLRIAASAAQGLAFSLGIPVLGVSTLETQVHTFLRRFPGRTPCHVLSTIDARIGQVYSAFFDCDGISVRQVGSAQLCTPETLTLPDSLGDSLFSIGSGLGYREALDARLYSQLSVPELLPEAVDMLAPALAKHDAGQGEPAVAAQPDYVQERVGWKTLAEQGRGA